MNIPSKIFYLKNSEIATLCLQNPLTKSDGGFQSLLVELQQQLNKVTGLIVLYAKYIERIYRYSHKYNHGGWQNMLRRIFGRVMPSIVLPLEVK